MALHDTDKGNNDRSSPVVNAHDRGHEVRMAEGTTSLHPTTDASSIPGFLQTKNLRILANDGTTNRGLFGYNQAMGLWGFFLTKFGIDVNTNTDTSQFIFNSNQDVFKIVASGTSSLPASGAISSSSSTPLTLVTIITHNLGYTPTPVVYAQLGTLFYVSGSYQAIDTYSPTPLVQPLNGFGAAQPYGLPSSVTRTGSCSENGLTVWFGVDSTKLYVQYFFDTTAGTGTVSSPGINFKYYLLQESLTS